MRLSTSSSAVQGQKVLHIGVGEVGELRDGDGRKVIVRRQSAIAQAVMC